MHVFKRIAILQDFLETKRKQKCTIGFVPTMGALHEGHLALMRRAKSENDILVVSIFVNPIQFNNPDDLLRYPRTIENDSKLLETVLCDAVFVPSVEEIYPVPETTIYNFGAIEQVMEGAFRKGHFNGVAIVVRKLFEIVKPNKAYFGEKDFQQRAIIQKMVENYAIPTEIISCEIVREPDGLAMSSRNMRLNETERTIAPQIFKTLKKAVLKKQELSPELMREYVEKQFKKIDAFNVEYVEIADEKHLQPIKTWHETKHARIFVALQLGNVRLIDNIRIF
ncbi:MAG: pantoate--beta-alanine ligase [Lentimicrobiaceae bacterium]|jgi:pantoate--beta-alanine ligase|nr:pantoate--beta-alanine ligase [Lentimicrobiaceae bacterium]